MGARRPRRPDVARRQGAQTLNAARQLRLNTEIGSLEAGKYADLVVLSHNPRRVPPDELRDVAVEATYLMGRQTYGKVLG
ncbi:hypothetical protein AWC02_05815 [Mycolicibacter engbaekii]|uniref:Amidohydrolase 3 domain-containing protein n=1 Tax=Mycolicibacter engbaekii TaxID=188915 RepID=A0A1X1TYZ4_9MYCO|nr:hypothetical protein AWC02_05815 [Mycolicibacter engbaekii]